MNREKRDQVPLDHEKDRSPSNERSQGLTILGSDTISLRIAPGARPSSRSPLEIFQRLADPTLAIETLEAIGGGLLESVSPRSSAEMRAVG